MFKCKKCGKLIWSFRNSLCEECRVVQIAVDKKMQQLKEEARRRQEEERKHQEEEQRQEEKRRRQEEEERKHQEEERQHQEEERRRQEEERRRKEEEERKRKTEEAARKKAQEEQKQLEASRTNKAEQDHVMINSFHTKLAGVTYHNEGANTENRQRIIHDLVQRGLLNPGQKLELQADPQNQFDHQAVAVFGPDGRQLGFLPKEIAHRIFSKLQASGTFKAYVTAVTGGDAGFSYGVNVRIEEYEIVKKKPSKSDDCSDLRTEDSPESMVPFKFSSDPFVFKELHYFATRLVYNHPFKFYSGHCWYAEDDYSAAFPISNSKDEYTHFKFSISGRQLMQKYPLPSDDYCFISSYINDDITEKQIRVPDKIDNKTVIGLGHHQLGFADSIFLLSTGYYFDENASRDVCIAIPLTPTSILLPRSLKFIMGMWGYASLNDIVLPKGLEYIGIGTFSGSSIESIVIPGSVQVIDKESFITNTLQSVTIEEGVKRIGKYAFGFFPHRDPFSPLKFVNLPRSIQYIDPTAFTGYTGYMKYDLFLDGEGSKENLEEYLTYQQQNRHLSLTIFIVPPDSYAQRFVKEMGYFALVAEPKKKNDT